MKYALCNGSRVLLWRHCSSLGLKHNDLFQVLCMRWHRNGTFISSALDQTVSVWSIDDTKLKFTLRYFIWLLLSSFYGETFQPFFYNLMSVVIN